MERVADINVSAWLKLLEQVYAASPGWEGANAIDVLTEQVVATTTSMLDAISSEVFIQRSLAAVRDELALLNSRMDSYRSWLDANAAAPTDSAGIIARFDGAGRIRGALLYGQQPPPLPPLAMGDSLLAATLYNQVLHAAVLDAEQSADAEHVASLTPYTRGTGQTVREWLIGAARELEQAAPGETPTLRDNVVRAVEDAANKVADLIKDPFDFLKVLLRWAAAGLGAALLVYLLWRSRQR